MKVLTVRNVNEALPFGLKLLKQEGIRKDSRNGPVLVMPQPVTTHYTHPKERVLFWAERDANPFFHLFESLWMLAGRKDLAYVKQYVKRMETFSDDGITLHGAYGYRWRNHFDLEGSGHPTLPDQLSIIIRRLRVDPTDRRCVLTMWDPVADLDHQGKDVPCNTQIYFWVRDVYLDMTVMCRSNDIIWGAYGANAVHFGALQEYMASCIGLEVGHMWQVSNNYHAYVNVFDPLYDKLNTYDGYRIFPTYPLITATSTQQTFDQDLEQFMIQSPGYQYQNSFFPDVALPMQLAHNYAKNKLFLEALDVLRFQCKALDWQKAGIEWVQRRARSYQRAADDGVSYE